MLVDSVFIVAGSDPWLKQACHYKMSEPPGRLSALDRRELYPTYRHGAGWI
jgi:hypothetical protein